MFRHLPFLERRSFQTCVWVCKSGQSFASDRLTLCATLILSDFCGGQHPLCCQFQRVVLTKVFVSSQVPPSLKGQLLHFYCFLYFLLPLVCQCIFFPILSSQVCPPQFHGFTRPPLESTSSRRVGRCLLQVK